MKKIITIVLLALCCSMFVGSVNAESWYGEINNKVSEISENDFKHFDKVLHFSAGMGLGFGMVQFLDVNPNLAFTTLFVVSVAKEATDENADFWDAAWTWVGGGIGVYALPKLFSDDEVVSLKIDPIKEVYAVEYKILW